VILIETLGEIRRLRGSRRAFYTSLASCKALPNCHGIAGDKGSVRNGLHRRVNPLNRIIIE
jgi:hypothetical protein